MRPAAGVWCRACLDEKGHRCQAQIYIDAGESGEIPLCMPCADEKPCVVDRVGAPPKPEDEVPMFEAVEDHVPVAPVIHRTAAELGLPDVLPPDPQMTRDQEQAARKLAAKLHAAVEARAKNAARLPQVKVIGGERVSMTPGVVIGPEMLNLNKEKTEMPKGYEKVERNMQIVEAAREGVTVPEIASRFQMSKQTIYSVLARHKVTPAAAPRGHRKALDGGAKREAKPAAAPKKGGRPPKNVLALRPGQRAIAIGGEATAAVDVLLAEDVTFEVRMPMAEARRRLEQLTPAQVAVALRAVVQASLG